MNEKIKSWGRERIETILSQYRDEEINFLQAVDKMESLMRTIELNVLSNKKFNRIGKPAGVKNDD